MFMAGKLNSGSFVILVRSEPTAAELQHALDAQNLIGRLRLTGDEPIEVLSETPVERLWRGWLEDREVSFKIGTLPPSRLPGVAGNRPNVRAWPLAMWTTNTTATSSDDHIAAGAMSLLAWAAATGGVAYHGYDGLVVADLSSWRRLTDLIIAGCLNRLAEFEARYPDERRDRARAAGQDAELSIRVL